MERKLTKLGEEDLLLVNKLKYGTSKEKEVAFNSIYKKYHDLVNFKFSPLIQEKAYAQELIQDVFIRMYRNIYLYDPDISNFSTWIFKLAKNVYISGTRKEKIERKITPISLLSKVNEEGTIEFEIKDTNPSGTPEKLYLSKEKSKIVNDLLNSLENPIDIEMIKLKYQNKFTQQKIADTLNFSLSFVKVRLHRASNELRIKFIMEKLYPDFDF